MKLNKYLTNYNYNQFFYKITRSNRKKGFFSRRSGQLTTQRYEVPSVTGSCCCLRPSFVIEWAQEEPWQATGRRSLNPCEEYSASLSQHLQLHGQLGSNVKESSGSSSWTGRGSSWLRTPLRGSGRLERPSSRRRQSGDCSSTETTLLQRDHPGLHQRPATPCLPTNIEQKKSKL